MLKGKNQRRTYIIAELGNNHDGSFEKAKELVHAAYESGADAVKFQCINYDKWLSPELKILERARGTGFQTQLERMKNIELSVEYYIELCKLAKSLGIDVGCTIFDWDILARLNENLTFQKVSSGDMHCEESLNIADAGNGVAIISVGLARSKMDIDRAIRCFVKKTPYIMHCVSEYPLDYTKSNLNNIIYLQEKFGSNRIGYSDHTIGTRTSMEAMDIGIVLLEKHFKLERDSDGIGDKPLSASPSEMREICRYAEECWENSISSNTYKEEAKIIEPVYTAHKTESWVQLVRKAHARRTIKKGETITDKDCYYTISGKGFFTQFDVIDNIIVAQNEIDEGVAIDNKDVNIQVTERVD